MPGVHYCFCTDYDNMDKKASIDLSKLLEQNPDDFADLLNMDDSLLESKEKFQGAKVS